MFLCVSAWKAREFAIVGNSPLIAPFVAVFCHHFPRKFTDSRVACIRIRILKAGRVWFKPPGTSCKNKNVVFVLRERKSRQTQFAQNAELLRASVLCIRKACHEYWTCTFDDNLNMVRVFWPLFAIIRRQRTLSFLLEACCENGKTHVILFWQEKRWYHVYVMYSQESATHHANYYDSSLLITPSQTKNIAFSIGNLISKRQTTSDIIPARKLVKW